jgi:hypothetical protein
MPAERSLMQRVREILRLYHEYGISDYSIGQSLSIACSIVAPAHDRPPRRCSMLARQ